jgi:AraC-like DNA-binding protein
LRERLLAAPTPEAKFQVLESCLIAQALKPLENHTAVRYALGLFLNIHAAPSVAAVTDSLGLSSRHFIQLFGGQVGLTPKLFCRVRRFQQVLKLVHSGGEVDWADVAADCGYYDQAHFIHDFRAFAGINPTTYLANKTEHLNHVPIHE